MVFQLARMQRHLFLRGVDVSPAPLNEFTSTIPRPYAINPIEIIRRPKIPDLVTFSS